MDDDGGMESLFSTFMNEVSNIKSNKRKKIEEKAGSPDEVIDRILSGPYDPLQGQGSAYMILQVSPDASEGDITKAYRKLSILIHPDKCKLERASEAFQILAKAYADTKDPKYNDKYRDVVQLAKDRVRKQRAKENEARQKRGEDPLDMEGNDFDQELLRECERMTTETTERAEYTNSVLEANMKRMEAQAKEAKARRREEEAEKRKWEKQRDKRVAGWQVFMQNVESKKFKTETLAKVGKVAACDVFYRREERKDLDKKGEVDREDITIKRSNVQAGQTGIDRTYKHKWR